MTEAHWKKTADFMIGASLLPADADWRGAFSRTAS